MATNNLRIIYNNLVDMVGATVTASTTASGTTPASNMQIDSKSKVWRSGATKTVAFIITFPATGAVVDYVVGGFMLPFCNLSSTAQIKVRGYAAASGGTSPAISGTTSPSITPGSNPKFDTGWISAAPYQVFGLWNWGTVPIGANTYSYGGGTYGRVWIPTASQLAVKWLAVEISDPDNASNYIEASRIVTGPYWSPKYNTSYGLSSAVRDLSSHARTEAGDLDTVRGVRFNTLNFDMKYMDPNDRSRFLDIVRGNGLPRSLFISLFPDNTEDFDKEQQHQIYGKLSQLSYISHPWLEMYSTNIEIEEI